MARNAVAELLDNKVENLVPIVINKLRAGQSQAICGTDQPILDGTCIREYVHVRDIARTLWLLRLSMEGYHRSSSRKYRRRICEGVIRVITEALDELDIVALKVERLEGNPAYLCDNSSSILMCLV